MGKQRAVVRAVPEIDPEREIERLVQDLSDRHRYVSMVERAERTLGRLLVANRLGRVPDEDVDAARAIYEEAKRRLADAELMLTAARAWAASFGEQRRQEVERQQEAGRVARQKAFEAELAAFKSGFDALRRDKEVLLDAARRLFDVAASAGMVPAVREYFEELATKPGLEELGYL